MPTIQWRCWHRPCLRRNGDESIDGKWRGLFAHSKRRHWSGCCSRPKKSARWFIFWKATASWAAQSSRGTFKALGHGQIYSSKIFLTRIVVQRFGRLIHFQIVSNFQTDAGLHKSLDRLEWNKMNISSSAVAYNSSVGVDPKSLREEVLRLEVYSRISVVQSFFSLKIFFSPGLQLILRWRTKTCPEV